MSSSIQSEGAGMQPPVRLLPEADRRTCSRALIAVRSSERVSLQLTNRIARIGRNRYFQLWNDRSTIDNGVYPSAPRRSHIVIRDFGVPRPLLPNVAAAQHEYFRTEPGDGTASGSTMRPLLEDGTVSAPPHGAAGMTTGYARLPF
jgi:hypothetical protein